MSYMGILYGSLFGACTVCLAMMLHFNRNLRFALNSRILWDNIKYGLQVMPKSFSGFINRFFDKYMLNNMLSLSAVGVYNIGQTIGNALFFLMSTVWSSFQPVYYGEVFEKGRDGSVSVGRLFTMFAYITLMPVLLLILFAQELVYIIAPPSYYDAIDIIIIVSGGVATQTFGMYVGVQYAYSKKAYWIFPATVVGTLANVAANIFLIPRFGMIGAGFSAVISTCMVNGILTLIGQKLYRIQYEWQIIATLYAIITSAIVLVLYFRVIEFNGVLAYLFKLTFIALFIFAGIKAKLITRQSIEKVQSALFNFPKRKEA
jgi:O-antigen/teichoic acid export membrane protein